MDVTGLRRKLRNYAAISILCAGIFAIGSFILDWNDIQLVWMLGLLGAVFVGVAYGYIGAAILLKKAIEDEQKEAS